MTDPIIASVLAKAGLDTGGKIEGVADGRGTDGGRQPAEPAALGTDEADDSADAEATTGDANNDDDEADDGAEAHDDEADDDEADDGPDDNNDDDGASNSDASDEPADDNGDERAATPEEEDDNDPASGDDDAADDGGEDDPAKAIVEAFPVNDEGEQDVEVVEVIEPASCLALPSKATAAKEDRRLVELRGKGFTDEQLRAVGAVLTTASRRQRKLPVHAAVCSAVMQAYWAGRDRERREADCLKAIRNDGGQLGPVRYYESIIRKHDPLAAAKLIAEHHADRIRAIRFIVGATMNEGRREDAIAKGINPTTVKYLAVRTK
jgi:hypothetical protein